jgi:16S rRNA (cytosine967-C5)-methyltransferase
VSGGKDRERISDALQKNGIPSRFGNLSPAALILEERHRVTDLDLYRNGAFEVQDEGSQMIGYAASPQESARVLDACAGAGGKTLHLASLMHGAGGITASDTERKRLKELLPRAHRSGFDTIETASVKTLLERIGNGTRYDTVLIDAPCSSLGTARRLPHPKWRLAPGSLDKLSQKQLEILSMYAKAVAPGGILVYATCSLLPQENSGVISRFLASNPAFAPDPLEQAFHRHGVRLPEIGPDAYSVQLTPLEHGTDGFYIARMKRSN